MSNVRKLLAKMSVRTSSFGEMTGGGTGGLSSSDVAFAVAQCRSKLSELILLVKWADQREDFGKLVLEFIIAVERRARKKRWKSRKLDTIQRIAYSVVDEDINPRLCRQCNGRGDAIIEQTLFTCDKCSGTGVLPWQDKDRAKLVGLTRQSFTETWKGRYQECQEILRGAEIHGLGCVNRALSDEEPEP